MEQQFEVTVKESANGLTTDLKDGFKTTVLSVETDHDEKVTNWMIDFEYEDLKARYEVIETEGLGGHFHETKLVTADKEVTKIYQFYPID